MHPATIISKLPKLYLRDQNTKAIKMAEAIKHTMSSYFTLMLLKKTSIVRSLVYLSRCCHKLQRTIKQKITNKWEEKIYKIHKSCKNVLRALVLYAYIEIKT